MSFVPPWLGLLLVLLTLGALAAGVLQRGLKKQVQVVGPEQQSQTNRRIAQEHLADLDRALAEGRPAPPPLPPAPPPLRSPAPGPAQSSR